MTEKVMLSLNKKQAQELRKLLRIADSDLITSAAIKQAFGLSPDEKAGRPKGAKNKEKSVI